MKITEDRIKKIMDFREPSTLEEFRALCKEVLAARELRDKVNASNMELSRQVVAVYDAIRNGDDEKEG